MNDCDNCPIKSEHERLRFELGTLRVSLRTVETHKSRDILDLETRLREVEIERDWYKNTRVKD